MDELKNQVPGGFSAMVNAYLDGSLTSEKESYVEEIVATNPSASKIFQQRSNERDKIKSLIPHVEITKDSLRTLKESLEILHGVQSWRGKMSTLFITRVPFVLWFLRSP